MKQSESSFLSLEQRKDSFTFDRHSTDLLQTFEGHNHIRLRYVGQSQEIFDRFTFVFMNYWWMMLGTDRYRVSVEHRPSSLPDQVDRVHGVRTMNRSSSPACWNAVERKDSTIESEQHPDFFNGKKTATPSKLERVGIPYVRMHFGVSNGNTSVNSLAWKSRLFSGSRA